MKGERVGEIMKREREGEIMKGGQRGRDREGRERGRDKSTYIPSAKELSPSLERSWRECR